MAHVPDALAGNEDQPDARAARLLERAAGALRRADEHLPARFEPLFRLLLRAEGIASSDIEGLRAPLPEMGAAEVSPAPGTTAATVAANLRAVVEAVGDAQAGALDQAVVDRWHGTLMADSAHLAPEHIGAVRTQQSWVGGVSPLDAALVPPPPELVPALMLDLMEFANRADVDPVLQAAMVHVQFESIHPYADGNGRIGRILIGWVLTRRLELRSPPPVSVHISADRGGYLANMSLWRLGTHGPWITWFASIVNDAARSAFELVDRLDELQSRWSARLAGVRADASVWPLLELLPARPALTAAHAAEHLGVSQASAREALLLLEAEGIVTPFVPARAGARGRPRRWWVAHDVTALVESWALPG